MRITGMILCSVFSLFAVGVRAEDTPEVAKDRKKFQGTWTFESVEAGGKKLPPDLFKDMTVTFEGDHYSVKMGSKVVEAATQKLDPSRSPRTLDATVTEGPNKGSVILGIYEIDGDTLKVCFDPEGKKRPTAFTSNPSPQLLVVHKRMKR